MSSFMPESVFVQRAQHLFSQQRLDLAEPELRRALAEDPQNATAHAMLAFCLSRREENDEALREAKLAVGIEPDNPYTHYALACVLDGRDELDEAETAIREAISLDPADPDAHSLLGGLHYQRHRWKDALAAAEQALEYDPEHVNANNLRAMSLVKLGRKDEAGQTIGAALARDPDNAVTHANMGWTHLNQGDSRAALESFREALRLEPGLEWARAGLVTALKARNPIYALFLRYVLWMQKLPPKVRVGIIIGLYILYRVLNEVRRNNPQLAPYIVPMLILYGVFVLTSWLADPLFNLLLRLHPMGRHALTSRERWSGDALALCFLGAAGAVAAWFATKQEDFLIIAAAVGMLALPVTSAIAAGPGRHRKIMAAFSILAGLLIIAATGIVVASGFQTGGGLAAIAVLVIVAGTWISIPSQISRR